MDTSETYIKMCEKAEEIQEYQMAMGWASGDFMYDGREVLVWCRPCGLLDTELGDKRIWLPRQDQLQILSGLSWQEFDKECLKYDTETKEQAGICVAMDYKFNKKWQDGEWLDKTTQ